MLIAFTLAVAVIIGAWLTSVSRQTTETTGKSLLTQVNCSKAILTIVDATCTNNSLTVAVANLGSIDLTNPNFYARLTNGTSIAWAMSGTTISPGGTLVNTTTPGWSGGTLDYVSITALCSGTTGITTEKSSIGDAC
jgi:hypothetical protein